MTDLDQNEARLLASARRGLSPTLSDRERIARGLAAQLAVTEAPRTHPKQAVAGALRAAPWVGVAGLVALGSALGYFQGYRAGRKAREVVTVVRSVPAAPAAISAPSVLEATSPPPQRSQEAASVTTTKAARATKVEPSSRSADERPPPVAPSGLDEEVRQLRRVEKAIRENNPRFALVLLDELDKDIPHGQLDEERKAASVLANCELDPASARDAARAYVTRYARGAYVTRVRELCELPAESDERISPAPGTSVPR